jgi:outer membrane lipopolysaccharide assembly protein LptE/RlpB
MLRLLAFASLILLTGCAYHAVGAASHLPGKVQTLAVPVFKTDAQAYHTEQAFTAATIRELNTRTRYQIVTADSQVADADAILRGTILSESSAPLTYDSSSGQTSSYLITIVARVLLTTHDGRVLYRNDAMTFREQYQSTEDITSFIQEDGPAVQRVAREFASTLVSSLLESF